MSWIDDLKKKVSSLFAPADPYAGFNVNTPGNPAYDPQLASINSTVAQLKSTIPSTNQYIAQNQQNINNTPNTLLTPLMQLAVNIQRQKNAGSAQMAGPAGPGGTRYQAPDTGYSAPQQSSDPLQTLALFGILKNLNAYAMPKSPVQSAVSTAPYTQAANSLASERMANQASVLPSVYGNLTGGTSFPS